MRRISGESAVPSLVIVGYSASGKSTLAEIISRSTSFPVIEIGDIVRRKASQASPAVQPLDYADQTFARGDYLHFVLEAAQRADEIGRACVLVGPRRPEELAFLATLLEPCTSVALMLPEEMRRSRCWVKGVAPAAASRRDDVERRWGIQRTLDLADHQVDASYSPDVVAKVVFSVLTYGAITQPVELGR